MPEPAAADTDDQDALGALTQVLCTQAAALHRLFFRATILALSTKGPRSFRDARTALKAQHLCRQAINVLLALRALAQQTKAVRIGQGHTADLLALNVGNTVLAGEPLVPMEVTVSRHPDLLTSSARS